MSRQPERDDRYDRHGKPDGPDMSRPCWHSIRTLELITECAADGCPRCLRELENR